MHETGFGAFIKICEYCIKMARPNSKKQNKKKKTQRKKSQKGGYAMPSRSRGRNDDSDGVRSRSRSCILSASRRNKP